MLLNATSNQTKFKAVNIEISNFLSRLSNGNQNLIKKKVQQIFKEYENFVLAQFDFNVDFNVETLEIGMDLNEVYQHAILSSEDFIENIRNKNFPVNQTKKLIEIIEKLYREYALSLNDLKFINESINQMKRISL
jgi:hypothetical protein